MQGTKVTKYECQNCSKLWDEDELNEIRDLSMRVGPGEIMPAGECPNCGAVCHARVERRPAPELLEAAKDALERLDTLMDADEATELDVIVRNKLSRAIARAEGRD